MRFLPIIMIFIYGFVYADDFAPNNDPLQDEFKKNSEASDSNERGDDERLCMRRYHELKYLINKMSDEDRSYIKGLIKGEFDYCKGDEKCICGSYKFLLKKAKEVANSRKYDIGVHDFQQAGKEKRKKDEVLRNKNLYRKGKKLKRAGVGLLIPGCIITFYGLVAAIGGGIATNVCECDDYLWDDDCDDDLECQRIGYAFLVSSIGPLALGVHMVVAGSVLVGVGKSLINKSSNKSYSFSPLIDTKSKTYGLRFSMNF